MISTSDWIHLASMALLLYVYFHQYRLHTEMAEIVHKTNEVITEMNRRARNAEED